MTNLKYGFEVMNKDLETVSSSSDLHVYSHLSAVLQDIDVLLREQMQKMSQEHINKVIRKLKDEVDLSTHDMEQVERWIIGDAESYNKMENNFVNWKTELKRLIAAINQYKKDDPDVETIMTLRALLRDANKVLTDILYFVQQQERIRNFKKNITELTFEDKEILIRLLEQKIKSWDR